MNSNMENFNNESNMQRLILSYDKLMCDENTAFAVGATKLTGQNMR